MNIGLKARVMVADGTQHQQKIEYRTARFGIISPGISNGHQADTATILAEIRPTS